MKKLKWKRDTEGFWILEVKDIFKTKFIIKIIKNYGCYYLWVTNGLHAIQVSDGYYYIKDIKEKGLKIAVSFLED